MLFFAPTWILMRGFALLFRLKVIASAVAEHSKMPIRNSLQQVGMQCRVITKKVKVVDLANATCKQPKHQGPVLI